jgi:hypothetical protein
MMNPPCLTLRRDPARSATAGSVLIHGWAHGNTLVDKPTARRHAANVRRRTGVRAIPTTSSPGACKREAHGHNRRNRCACHGR